jgi:hypothetical protein
MQGVGAPKPREAWARKNDLSTRALVTWEGRGRFPRAVNVLTVLVDQLTRNHVNLLTVSVNKWTALGNGPRPEAPGESRDSLGAVSGPQTPSGFDRHCRIPRLRSAHPSPHRSLERSKSVPARSGERSLGASTVRAAPLHPEPSVAFHPSPLPLPRSEARPRLLAAVNGPQTPSGFDRHCRIPRLRSAHPSPLPLPEGADR